MKNNRIFILLLFAWFIGIFLFVQSGKFDASLLPSLLPEFNRQEKIVSENDGLQAAMISYGPYEKLDKGHYLLIINYNAQCEGNTYDIASELGSNILQKGLFTSKKDWKFARFSLKKETIIELRTYYGGKGTFRFNKFIVISCEKLLYLIALLIGMSLILLWWQHTSKYEIGGYFVVLSGTIAMAIAIFPSYACISIVIFSIAVEYSLMLQKNNLYEKVYELSLVSVLGVELLNFKFYPFSSLRLLIYDVAIVSIIYVGINILFANKKIGCYTIAIITEILLLYETAQYVYYSFFRSFFRIRAIRLIGMASGANASIKTLLLNRNSLCYMMILIMYNLIGVCLLIYKKTSIGEMRDKINA